MQPQTLESYLPHVQEQLAGIFEECPIEELFSSEVPISNNNEAHLPIPTEAPSSSAFSSFDIKQQEIIMNTETHVYNYSSNADPATQADLTQRLYSSAEDNSFTTQHAENKSQPNSYELKKDTLNYKSTSLQKSFANESTSDNSLEIEQAIQNYHRFQSAHLSHYLERWLKRPLLPDYCLQIFHGWKTTHDKSQQNLLTSSENITNPFADAIPNATGGFYLRWNNTGIVINPGKKFMQHFHQAGLHIKDIDIVIVTDENSETYADILEIYELNFRLNRASGDQQIIHYYLNQNAYRELSVLLKPHSKSERNAIHCLEFFPESPDVEQIVLRDGILLNYFLTQPQFSTVPASSRHQLPTQSNLGIRLELSQSHLNEVSNVTLGYVSGSWSPFIGQHLSESDILIAGIGNTNQSDYNKIVHPDDCLGYYGVCSLIEDIQPKLVICTEFGSREGDLRLELIKKIRLEFADTRTSILPGDIGMSIDLKSRAVKCSITNDYVDPSEIRVARSSGLFGMLHYLASSNFI